MITETCQYMTFKLGDELLPSTLLRSVKCSRYSDHQGAHRAQIYARSGERSRTIHSRG